MKFNKQGTLVWRRYVKVSNNEVYMKLDSHEDLLVADAKAWDEVRILGRLGNTFSFFRYFNSQETAKSYSFS